MGREYHIYIDDCWKNCGHLIQWLPRSWKTVTPSSLGIQDVTFDWNSRAASLVRHGNVSRCWKGYTAKFARSFSCLYCVNYAIVLWLEVSSGVTGIVLQWICTVHTLRVWIFVSILTTANSRKAPSELVHWLPVRQRIIFKTAVLVLKCICGMAPTYLADHCKLMTVNTGRCHLQSTNLRQLSVPQTRTAYMYCDRSFTNCWLWFISVQRCASSVEITGC